ncbi:MAG: endonuclease III [Myxococcota bacterium]|jgi:endonuclease-3|nr:endonuclease III [Myxococcota bacterium]
MTKRDKAERIAAVLNALFPAPTIPLEHRDPYTLLVATVLSAQCTDKRVNEVTPRLFGLADNPFDMSQLPVPTIEEVVRSCGLSKSKAKAIRGLSEILVTEHGGSVPSTFEALERLPGVGHKTASVVMGQAFGQPAFPVDTHIHRLAARWGLSSGKSVEQTEKDLKLLFPIESWGKLHLQIITFARAYCPARGHVPLTCPICSFAARPSAHGKAG